MILATGRDTGMAAYIYVKEIDRTEKMRSSSGSFTRVFLKNPKENLEYFLDVKEKPEELKRRIKEERHILGRGEKKNEQQTDDG